MADSSTCGHRDFGLGGGGGNSSDKDTPVKLWAENTGLWVIKSSQSTWGGTRAHKHRDGHKCLLPTAREASPEAISTRSESSSAVRSARIQSSPAALLHRQKSSKLREGLITESPHLTTAPPAPARCVCPRWNQHSEEQQLLLTGSCHFQLITGDK